MRSTLSSLLFLAALTPTHLPAQDDAVARILLQEGSPITIESYEAAYTAGTRRGIQHDVRYRNVTDRPIRAVRFGFVSFDVFNEFLDRTGGISMDPVPPGILDHGAWVATAYGSFAFFTGLAYVRTVRFGNGEIWEADMDPILQQIRQVQADFDASRLSEEADGAGS